MDPEPPLSAGNYWYLGSPDPAIDQLFRRACALAWPYAVYCAARYHHDSHLAYDLMDQAVENAEQYYERFTGQCSAVQLSYRIVSVIKRLSKQRENRNREIAAGTLSDLEILTDRLAAKSEIEQDGYIHQLLGRMTGRTREIVYWRLAGHTWRQIADDLGANHITLWREVRTEIRGLLQLNSDTHDSDEGDESD